MSSVLVMGISGSGSTVLDVQSGRGVATVFTICDDWVLPDGTWDEPRMAQHLVEHRDVVVSGTASNQGRIYDRLHRVILGSAPYGVLLERVGTATNPYGHKQVSRCLGSGA